MRGSGKGVHPHKEGIRRPRRLPRTWRARAALGDTLVRPLWCATLYSGGELLLECGSGAGGAERGRLRTVANSVLDSSNTDNANDKNHNTNDKSNINSNERNSSNNNSKKGNSNSLESCSSSRAVQMATEAASSASPEQQLVPTLSAQERQQLEIEATAAFLVEQRFRVVCLQLPNHLLRHAAALVQELRTACRPHQVSLHVLADTTSSDSCCVDEVGAAHVQAECVVHYGRACLTHTSRTAAFFALGQEELNVMHCAQQIMYKRESIDDPAVRTFSCVDGKHITLQITLVNAIAVFEQVPLLVLYDLKFSYLLDSLKAELQKQGANLDVSKPSAVCVAEIVYKQCLPGDAMTALGNESCESQEADATPKMERVGGLMWPWSLRHSTEAEGTEENEGAESQPRVPEIFWLAGNAPEEEKEYEGETSPALTNLLMTLGAYSYTQYNAAQCLETDSTQGDGQSVQELEPIAATSTQRMLKRRYFLIEKAREANIIGIVVATLGARGYREVLERLKKKIADAGKKSYTIVMGRVQPAKLGNFPECEVFVMLSCPESVILDCKEFYQPIITPFEADIALSDDKFWTGTYEMHMERTLLDVDQPREPKDTADEEEQFSFISGGYIKSRSHVPKSSAAATVDDDLDESNEGSQTRSGQIVNVNGDKALFASGKSQYEKDLMVVTTATEYLKLRRTYQGAEWDVPEDAPEHVEEGLTGRAATYKSEPSTR